MQCISKQPVLWPLKQLSKLQHPRSNTTLPLVSSWNVLFLKYWSILGLPPLTQNSQNLHLLHNSPLAPANLLRIFTRKFIKFHNDVIRWTNCNLDLSHNVLGWGGSVHPTLETLEAVDKGKQQHLDPERGVEINWEINRYHNRVDPWIPKNPIFWKTEKIIQNAKTQKRLEICQN